MYFVLLLILCSCSAIHEKRGQLIDTFSSKEDVQAQLGSPTFVSTFSNNGYSWYYIAQDTEKTSFFDPVTKKQTVIEVLFDSNGKILEVKRDHKVTQTIKPNAAETKLKAPSASKEIFQSLGKSLQKR
jgi:outer membrane protein assembly factor BamE (lipoprotein component of BamABCDE complex)